MGRAAYHAPEKAGGARKYRLSASLLLRQPHCPIYSSFFSQIVLITFINEHFKNYFPEKFYHYKSLIKYTFHSL